jgi:hypothetical protein
MTFVAEKKERMLMFVIFVIVWLLGLVRGHTIGGFIHFLRSPQPLLC